MLPDMTLEVLSISHQYTADTPVLVDMSLLVGENELVALVGASGCGKTTLLHCIAGLIEPDKGEIQIDNKCVNGIAPFNRNIGLVMQDQPLYEHLSVVQNIAFPARAEGGNTKIIASRVEETVEQPFDQETFESLSQWAFEESIDQWANEEISRDPGNQGNIQTTQQRIKCF